MTEDMIDTVSDADTDTVTDTDPDTDPNTDPDTDTVTEPRLKGAKLLDREGEFGADYLEGLLDIADLDGDIEMDVEGNRAMVSVLELAPGELQHLVGPNGRVLDALQELTRLAATRETGERSRLMLDIAGFRAARRAELVTIAEAAVAEAQRTAAPVRLEPMSPFERKVVHDVVADAGLSSESEGDEPARRVVIRTA